MEFFTSDNLALFIVLFLPGFISVKIYHQLVANEKYDFSKNLLEIVGISLFNLMFNSWLILINIEFGWIYQSSILFYISCLWIFIVAPSVYPFLVKELLEHKTIKRHFISNSKQPWDYHFCRRKANWVIVKLRSGELIGGYYGSQSRASVYPCAESLYIEQVWIMDEKKVFLKKRSRSAGMLILTNTIETVEFIN